MSTRTFVRFSCRGSLMQATGVIGKGVKSTEAIMKAIKSLSMLSWLLLFPFIVHAGDVPGTYARYQWGAGVAGLTSVDYVINVQANPGYRANVLWSDRFHFAGSRNGGYAGMEDNANLGPNFVFSVRGATQYKPGSAGSYCVVNDRGVTCRLPYDWQSTDQYQFHVAYEGGQWLGVTVTQLYSNPLLTFDLGSILTDATSLSTQGMVSRTTYLEANSPTANCYNQPYSDVIFSTPSGNNGQYTATESSTGTNTSCASFSSVLNGEQTNGAGNLLRGEAVSDGTELCIDAGDGKTNGVVLTTQNCNKKSEGQAWVYAKDGTMRLQSNLCLDIQNPDALAGAVVIADPCTGSASQQWSLYGDGNMLRTNLSVSYLDGYCVTWGNSGAPLTLQDCTGNSQIWILPLLPVLP